MSNRYSAIPDFTSTPESMAATLRAMKDIVEELAGNRQGSALGAPSIYIQGFPPQEVQRLRLRDLWINSETDVMHWWTGAEWRPIA